MGCSKVVSSDHSWKGGEQCCTTFFYWAHQMALVVGAGVKTYYRKKLAAEWICNMNRNNEDTICQQDSYARVPDMLGKWSDVLYRMIAVMSA